MGAELVQAVPADRADSAAALQSKRRILSRGAASQPRPRAALWPVSRAKLSMYDYTVEH